MICPYFQKRKKKGSGFNVLGPGFQINFAKKEGGQVVRINQVQHKGNSNVFPLWDTAGPD